MQLPVYATDQRSNRPDTDLGTRGKLLKKILSSSLLCFFQSKDLTDAIATTLIMRHCNRNIENYPRGRDWRACMATPPSQQKKRKTKKQGRAVSESPSITRLKGNALYHCL